MTWTKIDIKSETQAIESGELPANYMEMAMEEDYQEDEPAENYSGEEDYTSDDLDLYEE